MKIAAAVLAFLLIADALFAWANIRQVEHILQKLFPRFPIRLLITIELILGIAIIAYLHHSLTVN